MFRQGLTIWVNAMVSLDIILEASVTMLVGTVFVVSLRQALKIPTTKKYLTVLVWPMLLFAISGAFAVVDEWPPPQGYPAGSFGWWAKVFFILGMFVLAFMVASLPGELDARQKTVEAMQKRLDALEAQAERLVLADKPKTRRKQPKR